MEPFSWLDWMLMRYTITSRTVLRSLDDASFFLMTHFIYPKYVLYHTILEGHISEKR